MDDNSIKVLKAGCPSVLEEALGVLTEARWFAFWWEATHGQWSDGKNGGGIGYSPFAAYVRHPVVALEARVFDLCSCEESAKYAIACDREQQTAWVAPIRETLKLLAEQHGPLTETVSVSGEEWEFIERTVAAEISRENLRTLLKLDSGNQVGEQLARRALESARVRKLLDWMDANVDNALIEAYIRDGSR